ncbi:hypothetical protein [Gemmobacter megaterium]|nr:hypothetical protein [Gemmobacter megaterium]
MRRRSGGNVFAVDVLDDSALPPLRGEINRIAVTYYVPVNVLLAIASLAGAEDRKSILCISEVSGRELEASVALGHDLAGAICAKIGDSAKCEAVIKEAYRIADVIDPKPKPVPEVPQVRQSADDDTKKRPRQRNVETARRWAIRTMNDTRSCLAGVENETFELDGDCGASWDYNSRLNHYLQIIEGLPPPIYP